MGFGRYYTPDFLLNLVSGQKVYVEIKPIKKLQDPELVERFRFIEHYLNKSNSSFVLITDLELDRPFIYENFNFLRPFRRQSVSSKTYEKIKRALLNTNVNTISELLEQADSINQIYTLIANNYLTCDLTSNINLSTKIKLTTENSHATCHISFRTMPDLKLNRFHYSKDT
ncbi:MAG: TnsA endonuclease N-terminal domain-containing protein [Cytophagia bacterium]|nr:TnsA endonuclease N-terminal domain-containing protein [Cytophagia bacterium]